jgi:Zn-dependent M16 (insulinase) family peptidase
VSLSKAVDEIWNGLSQFFTMQHLADGDMTKLAADLNRIRKTLLKAGAVVHLTADETGFDAAEEAATCLIARCALQAPASPKAASAADFAALTSLPWRKDRKEGSGTAELCVVPSQVGFAAKTLPGSPFGTADSAHESVFAHWLSNTLLWEQIRTIGGAYGAFALPDSIESAFSFATYRDPKPFQSLDAFTACLQKASATNFDTETLERAITGTYSREVQPRSPSSRAFTGFIRKLCGITNEQRDAKIAAMLAMTARDMQKTAERLLSQCAGDNPLAVIFGEENGFQGSIVDIPI